MGILRFIFIFVLVSWILRMIFRLLAPRILRKAFQKAQQGYTPPRKPEGAINIDYIPQHKTNKDPGGDFVEYEEIK